MREKLSRNLWILTFIFIFLGLISLISASSVIGQEKYNDPFYYIKKQLFQGIIIGLIFAFLASKINLEFLRKFNLFFLIINIILLLMCFLPRFSASDQDLAKRWLKIGPLVFQPSEFLKITYPLFLSNLLANSPLKKRRKIFGSPFLTYLISLGIISLIILKQPSTGPILVMGLSSLTMYFTASMSIWQFLICLISGGGLILYYVKRSPYRYTRLFSSFLSPEKDPLGSGYQILQSLTGIGLGGLLGVGFGNSIQKFNYLPQAHTDAIFSIIAEEFGFLGSLTIIILFSIFLWFGATIAKKSREKFLKYLAIGLTTNIVFQAFINIASMCRLLPITGIPLPFISYGGTAMVVNLTIVGLLINIAKNEI